MQAKSYLISDTTKEERIALIKSWIPEDEVMDGCDIDLWDMRSAMRLLRPSIIQIRSCL